MSSFYNLNLFIRLTGEVGGVQRLDNLDDRKENITNVVFLFVQQIQLLQKKNREAWLFVCHAGNNLSFLGLLKCIGTFNRRSNKKAMIFYRYHNCSQCQKNCLVLYNICHCFSFC